jgi:hypothetical protein
MSSLIAFASALLLQASAPHTEITQVAAADLPAEVVAVVKAAQPSVVIKEAELKVREGRRYYDVEGELPGGQEIEFDLLQGPSGWTVVEIQRDIPWADAPQPVREAAEGAVKSVNPVRVIESRQTDGVVIYELFAAGQPATPSLEVKWANGQASVLAEVWPH